MTVRGTAIVTGGGSGIGAACGVALAADGWRVLLVGRRAEALAAVAEARPDLDLLPTPADVTDADAVRAVVDSAVARFGRLDLLFNNAGRGAPAVDLDETSLADWRDVVEVNLTGAFLCTREAFRVMKAADPPGGRIINNGSISAHTPRPRSVAYTATKHAVTGLTKATALDGRAYGISCGQVDVGNAATDMTAAMADGVLQADGSTRPEARMDVADVARAVVYMASLPPGAVVATMTVMAAGMPFVGRG